MRTVLICHDDDALNLEGLSRWMASFSDLAGIVVLHENKSRLWQRIRRELKRIGPPRFLDVLLFRLFYRAVIRRKDRQWEQNELARLCSTYAPLSADVPLLHTYSPNVPGVERLLRAAAPDLMIARCKSLLKESVFSIPSKGTFVMHPGICPQYRNAHGCFWALAKNDRANVGMTLLRIDKGVDTGPVYGYFRCSYDERADSHIVIQHKVVFDNLDDIRAKLTEIHDGRAAPLDTSGRPSAAWGQPWLSSYVGWKLRARGRN